AEARGERRQATEEATDDRQQTSNERWPDGSSPKLSPVASRLSPADLARLEAERELILPERLRTLLVESRPPGAAVYLDSRQMERVTPCRLPEVPAGSHTVALALPGFMPYETVVDMSEGGEGEIRITAELEAEPPMGILEVVTFPAQATVTIEGVPGAAGPIGRSTPARLRLPAGRLTARIEPAGY